jgi:2-polyprenyl-3-methyl-5-hydroxy-6-metoxy-1,4-benzoquinol methylase
MIDQMEQLDYETKAATYFKYPRPEMLPFVPPGCRRVLDVGCADGSFGESLKRTRGAVEVWGVEPTRSAAVVAKTRLDRVVEGVFDSQTGLPIGSFDCILFNDVLEHMLAPELALRYAKDLLAPGGVVVASIPNIRSFPTIWQLMFHARWEYQDAGVLDRTHLRFFTRSSIAQMFINEGFILDRISGINPYAGIPNVRPRLWILYKVVNAFLLAKLDDMRFQQFAIVARCAV